MPARVRHGIGAWIKRSCLAALSLCCATTASLAQTYPDKPLRFVVPMAPGGSVDTVSRSVANVLSKRLGQPIVVDNRPGAGGTIAAGFVAHAPADGYTVFVADTGQLSVNPSLYKKLPYDPGKPFVPVIEAVSAPLYLAIHAELPVKSVGELITYAKSAKAPLAYGSVGVGSVHHLGMELFSAKSGVPLTHIPFKGASQSAVALAAGEVQLALSALPSLKPLIASGKVRLLAVTTPSRVPQMPEVPTVAESGLQGYTVAANVGFVLPPNTPDAIAGTLYREIQGVLATPEVQNQLTGMGLVMLKSTPRDYGQAILDDLAKYRELIRVTGASAE